MEKRDLKKKVTKTDVKTYVDEDGVVIDEIKHETFLVDREPDYVKFYIQDIGRIKDITSTQNEVLLAFIRHMGYNNVIPTYKPIKLMVAKDLNISLNTVNKAVSEFSKKGLFIPIARGMYLADPELFGKGKWSDIKSLRLVIEYKQDGTKKISSNLPEQIQLKLGL